MYQQKMKRNLNGIPDKTSRTAEDKAGEEDRGQIGRSLIGIDELFVLLGFIRHLNG